MNPTSTTPDRTVMIVEDHEMMRDALTSAVDRIDGFSVAQSVGSGDEAMAWLDDTDVGGSAIDVVMIDLSLPGMTGDQLVTAIVERHPHLICLIVSGHREPGYARRALAVGARGYVLKGYPEEIETALRAIVDGQVYLSPAIPTPSRGSDVDSA